MLMSAATNESAANRNPHVRENSKSYGLKTCPTLVRSLGPQIPQSQCNSRPESARSVSRSGLRSCTKTRDGVAFSEIFPPVLLLCLFSDNYSNTQQVNRAIIWLQQTTVITLFLKHYCTRPQIFTSRGSVSTTGCYSAHLWSLQNASILIPSETAHVTRVCKHVETYLNTI